MTDGQARGLPNVEQPRMVRKKELNKNINYVIHYHVFGVLINQRHDSGCGKAGIGVTHSILKSNLSLHVNKYVLNIALHNTPYIENFNPNVGGFMTNVSHMFRPMKNHHLIQVPFAEETRESNMGIQNDDINVPYNLQDMLTQSQIHKENGDHEVVEVDTIVSNVGVVNKHEHAVKDVQKLCKYMIYAVEDGGLYHDDIIYDIRLVPK